MQVNKSNIYIFLQIQYLCNHVCIYTHTRHFQTDCVLIFWDSLSLNYVFDIKILFTSISLLIRSILKQKDFHPKNKKLNRKIFTKNK